MAKAIMFDSDGHLQEPASMLYKKNVMAFRGSFRPITYVGLDMIKGSYNLFKRDPDYEKDNTITLCEITMNNLLDNGNFSEQDFLDRVDILNGIGQNVMVSDYQYYYNLVSYFSQFKIRNLRIIIGFPTFQKIFDKQYYTSLKGGILEAFGKLFTDKMKLYVYPALNKKENRLMKSHDISLPADLLHIFNYLTENRKILDVEQKNTKKLDIFSHRVLELIQQKNDLWKEMVSKYVCEQITQKKLFGYEG